MAQADSVAQVMAKSPSESNIHGKKFENRVNEAFKDLYKTVPCKWERVIDSAAAGNVIRTAESDFNLQINSDYEGRPYIFAIECKASILCDTFTDRFRSLIRPGQYAKLRIAMRSGSFGIYLFHAVNTKQIEVWDGKSLCSEWPNKRQKSYLRPAFTLSEANFKDFALWAIKNPYDFMTKIKESVV